MDKFCHCGATADQTGKVTAVAVGEATVTAACGGKQATCAVTVEAEEIIITGVTFFGDEVTLTLTTDYKKTLIAIILPYNAPGTVMWTSSDSEIATLDQTGSVTAVKAGSATITAACSGEEATCAVTVETDVIVAGDVYVAGYEFVADGRQIAKIGENGVARNLTDGKGEASAH